MTAVMQGVRILEVAEHTFVPAASALLADWGAEVIKIEHVERGDAMRGLASTRRRRASAGDVHVLLEHSNRGKKSLGLDLTSPTTGSTSSTGSSRRRDVFLTNKLPARAARSCRSTSTTSAPHNPNDHLRARHRPGRARPRRRQGLLRLPRVLGPRRHGRRRHAPGVRPRGARRRRPASATRSAR